MAPTAFQRRVIEQATGGSFEAAVAGQRGSKPEGRFSSGTKKKKKSTAGSTATPFQIKIIEKATGVPFEGTVSEHTTPQQDGGFKQGFIESRVPEGTLKNFFFGTNIKEFAANEGAGIVLGTVPLSPAGIPGGDRVGSILHTVSIHRWSRATGRLMEKLGFTLTKAPILAKTGKIGQSGISKLFQAGSTLGTNTARRLAVNTKTTALATGALSNHFGAKALAIGLPWAASVFMGKWASAEAAEPITFNLLRTAKIAEETGDWSTYDEYLEAAKEITDLTIWERVLGLSPFAAFTGSMRKLDGIRKGLELADKNAQAKRGQQEALAGEGFVSEFQKQQSEARDLQLQQRADDTAFFDQVAKDNRKRKLDERAADTAFFDALKKERTGEALTSAEEQRIKDWNAGKSTLNFKWLGL